MQHYLRFADLDLSTYQHILTNAAALKKSHHLFRQKKNSYQDLQRPFIGNTLGMIFQKPSTRTRVSFEAGFAQLGGTSLFLSNKDLQLSRGEPIEDTARVLSQMVDIFAIRTFAQTDIEIFAQNSTVPVINALTNEHHPCEILADIQTFIELRGDISGKKVVFIGDGNNVLHSYIEASHIFDFHLVHCHPHGYAADTQICKEWGNNLTISHNPQDAIQNADLVVTDVWTSMGDENENQIRLEKFRDFQVNMQLMQKAKDNALFMHCLPAHKGEEVDYDVLDSQYSAVWIAAENRLHSEKSLMMFLMNNHG